MKDHPDNHVRVLGIVASSRGIGYAVMEGRGNLVDWGVKTVKGDKNPRCLAHVANLLDHYKPDAIALENPEGSRRRLRVQTLNTEIAALAERESIRVVPFSRKQLNLGFFADRQRSKQALAEHLAARFHPELGFRLPRKRRIYTNEDSRMDIFGAVALAEHFLRSKRPPSKMTK